MWGFILIILAAAPVYSTKEKAPLENLAPEEKKLLFELVKRLGSDTGLDELEKAGQCAVTTNKSSIIKKNDSLQNGALFITSLKDVESNEACWNVCCRNKTCDLSVYEDKHDRYCYLFRCEGKCKFGHHSSYMSNFIQRHGRSLLPVADGSEQDLMDLDQGGNNDINEEDQFELTPAPVLDKTTTVYIRAHSVGLDGNFCQQDFHCEDPNAACLDNMCRCKNGFYAKGPICRKVCPPSNFECLGIGTLGQGPQCVSRDVVCDGITQCADGSDEFNCPDTNADTDGKGGKLSKTTSAPGVLDPVGGLAGGRPKQDGSEPSATKTATGSKPAVEKTKPEVDAPVSNNDGDSTNQQSPAKSNVDPGILDVNDNDKTGDKSSGNDKTGDKSSGNDKTGDKFSDKSKETPDNTKAGSVGNPAATAVSGDSGEKKDEKSSKDNNHSGGSEDLIEQQNAFILREKLDLTGETPSMQGPIIALSLGLAFTFILLVFVACRLRTVRRRLRKGRPLHSNEADYLINGMYL